MYRVRDWAFLVFSQLKILAATVLVHLVVVVLWEVDLHRAKFVDIGILLKLLCCMETLSRLAFVNGLIGGTVHVLHVEHVGVDLHVEHEHPSTDERVDIETVDEEDWVSK